MGLHQLLAEKLRGAGSSCVGFVHARPHRPSIDDGDAGNPIPDNAWRAGWICVSGHTKGPPRSSGKSLSRWSRSLLHHLGGGDGAGEETPTRVLFRRGFPLATAARPVRI